MLRFFTRPAPCASYNSGEQVMKRLVRETIEPITKRATQRLVWWAEPTGRGDGLYLVRCHTGVLADGLTQQQAMTVSAEFNLARSDTEALARLRSRARSRKSA